MRLTRLCTLALFVVLAVVGSAQGQPCQPPLPCGGLLQVTAGGELKATASSREFTSPTTTRTVIDIGDRPIRIENGVILAEYIDAADANTVRASAFALGEVSSLVGDLSLKGKATVLTGNVLREHGAIVDGRPRMGIRGGSGSAEVFLRADVTDFVSVETLSLPVGDRLLIRARLTISGGFTGSTSYHAFDTIHLLPVDGGPLVTPLDAGASVVGFASMSASKGALLVGDSSTVPSPIAGIASFRREYGINSHGVATETISQPPSEIFWTFVAPNRQADPMGYGVQLTMRAQAEAPTNAGIEGDFHGSIHWGGIVSVQNADTGELITDWTVTSQSGFDYSKSFEQQVPEPASIALLGFALCLWLRRARIRAPQPACL